MFNNKSYLIIKNVSFHSLNILFLNHLEPYKDMNIWFTYLDQMTLVSLIWVKRRKC